MITFRRQAIFLARWDDEGHVNLANAYDISIVIDLICSERNISRKDLHIELNTNEVFVISFLQTPTRFRVLVGNPDGTMFAHTSWKPFISYLECQGYRTLCRDSNASKSVTIEYCWQD